MRNAVFVLICGCLLFSCKTKKAKSFLETENLKGKVKSLTETFYPVEVKDGQPEKGDMWFKSVYTIGENGNKIDWKEYNADGTLRWKAVSTYTSDGKETYCTGYKADGTVDWKSVYTYDANGNKTQEEEFNATGGKNFKIIFKYDDKGVKTDRYFYTSDGSLYSKSSYLFDANGNQTEEGVYGADGVLKTTNICKYDDIDKMGNWHTQVQYANENIAMVSERVIEYY